MALLLATTAELKTAARVKSTATEDDALLAMRALIVAGRIQAWMGVDLEDDGAYVTEYKWGVPLQNFRFKLKRRPIKVVASVPVLTVYEDIAGQFSSSALATDEYDVNIDRGIVNMRWRPFLRGKGSLKVVYKGGYVADPATGILAVPQDIKSAFLLQFAFDWQRKDGPAVKGIVAGHTNMSFADDAIQPGVQELLWRYCRRDI